MVLPLGALGSWLLGQVANAARKGLSERLLGSEQERALDAAARAAIERSARELRPGGSDEDVEHLEAVLDQVFRVPITAVPFEEQRTILQALQVGIAAQLAVLDDAPLTGTGGSSAGALGLVIEDITQTLIRNVAQEILARGTGGGPLAPLANQLNHDLTHLQGERTAGMLGHIVEELAELRTQRVLAQPVPRELPRPVSDFTGRGDELARLRDLLAGSIGEPGGPPPTTGRPVVVSAIDGMGGIGKSALAIQAAHELAQAGAFPDGQLYLDLHAATPGLAPLDPLEALRRMLGSLGVEPAQVPTDTDEAAARFRSLVAGRRLLVLLDNAATPEQVRPLLPASPTCAVMVTSRRVLATLEGARALHLDVLPHAQALELLARLAGPERTAADPDAATKVVEHCGRLPLAIRIAGARLAARPGWTTSVLVARLADATRRVEELQQGELAVRASFDVSLQDLEQSPDPLDRGAAAAFGLLSLPDGPDLSVATAARLLDQPEDVVQRLLEQLVDAQLLETPHPDRYRFHDLVRLYAREHAQRYHPEPERLAALTRMLGFYTVTAWQTLAQLRPGDRRLPTADPRWTNGGLEFLDASAALDWLETERTNLVASIPQAAAAAPLLPPELACQLTRALFGFFHVRGYWQDGVEANRVALELARRTQDLPAQAHAHNDLGAFHFLLGRYEEATAYDQDGLTIFRELGDRHGEAISLSNLSLVYESLGRYEEATACHQDSLIIFRKLGDRQGEAISLNNLGNVYRRLGQYEEAIACDQDSLTIFRELGDRHGEAYSLSNLSLVYESLGRYEEAIVCQQDSLPILRELGDRRGEAISLNNLGLVYWQLGRHEEAIVCQQDSLTICRKLGDRHGEAYSLNNLGDVYWQLGRHEEAIACQQDSLTILRELGDRRGEAEVLKDLGDALRAVGRDPEARAAWQEALAICEALEVPEAGDIKDRLATLLPEVAGSPSLADARGQLQSKSSESST